MAKRVRSAKYCPNHKERQYLVRVLRSIEFRGLTPERVANSVALMEQGSQVVSVTDVETTEVIEFAGRCCRCQSWIRQSDKYSVDANGMECGDCRPSGCYGQRPIQRNRIVDTD